MRSIICVVVVLALIGLTGCGKQGAAPAAETEPQAEGPAISSEDFESGEVEDSLMEEEDDVEETPKDEGH